MIGSLVSIHEPVNANFFFYKFFMQNQGMNIPLSSIMLI